VITDLAVSAVFLKGRPLESHASDGLAAEGATPLQNFCMQKFTDDEALLDLKSFSDRRIVSTLKSVALGRRMGHLKTLFNYPEDIRRAMYTTNAIESLNSVIRKVS
jgi:transposase-like protein